MAEVMSELGIGHEDGRFFGLRGQSADDFVGEIPRERGAERVLAGRSRWC